MNRKWICSLAAPIVAFVLLATIGFAQQPAFIDKEPLGREAHSAVFDPNSKRMILFGGTTFITSQVEHLSDVWYLTNANSTSTCPYRGSRPTSPATRHQPGAVTRLFTITP